VDPLGGSFMVESLTNEMEQAAREYFRKIDALGGVVSGIEKGFFQREIAQSAYRYQQEIESKERILVGVNDYVLEEAVEIPLLTDVAKGQQRHLDRLHQVRRERDNREVTRRLNDLRDAAKGDANLMPYILDAVRAYATLGEMCGVLRGVFGEHTELLVA
jgi:methylmalonyl-CoA mutase N-terminal domain/subunit